MLRVVLGMSNFQRDEDFDKARGHEERGLEFVVDALCMTPRNGQMVDVNEKGPHTSRWSMNENAYC